MRKLRILVVTDELMSLDAPPDFGYIAKSLTEDECVSLAALIRRMRDIHIGNAQKFHEHLGPYRDKWNIADHERFVRLSSNERIQEEIKAIKKFSERGKIAPVYLELLWDLDSEILTDLINVVEARKEEARKEAVDNFSASLVAETVPNKEELTVLSATETIHPNSRSIESSSAEVLEPKKNMEPAESTKSDASPPYSERPICPELDARKMEFRSQEANRILSMLLSEEDKHEFSSTVFIEASVDVVWDVLTSTELYREWLRGTYWDYEPIPIPPTYGTPFRRWDPAVDKEGHICVILDWQPKSRFALYRGRVDAYEIRQEAEGCRVTMAMTTLGNMKLPEKTNIFRKLLFGQYIDMEYYRKDMQDIVDSWTSNFRERCLEIARTASDENDSDSQIFEDNTISKSIDADRDWSLRSSNTIAAWKTKPKPEHSKFIGWLTRIQDEWDTLPARKIEAWHHIVTDPEYTLEQQRTYLGALWEFVSRSYRFSVRYQVGIIYLAAGYSDWSEIPENEMDHEREMRVDESAAISSAANKLRRKFEDLSGQKIEFVFLPVGLSRQEQDDEEISSMYEKFCSPYYIASKYWYSDPNGAHEEMEVAKKVIIELELLRYKKHLNDSSCDKGWNLISENEAQRILQS